ncbi:MAG: hypothetical protein JWO34_2523 [Arthrobacter sp.]|jgi:hypothetical protein|nr:hypothetical protein [Arthrobacter sp.]MCU1520428.1 hypothetical protein [Arthrobacter sp.]
MTRPLDGSSRICPGPHGSSAVWEQLAIVVDRDAVGAGVRCVAHVTDVCGNEWRPHRKEHGGEAVIGMVVLVVLGRVNGPAQKVIGF